MCISQLHQDAFKHAEARGRKRRKKKKRGREKRKRLVFFSPPLLSSSCAAMYANVARVYIKSRKCRAQQEESGLLSDIFSPEDNGLILRYSLSRSLPCRFRFPPSQHHGRFDKGNLIRK
jgi:hypothetical protein